MINKTAKLPFLLVIMIFLLFSCKREEVSSIKEIDFEAVAIKIAQDIKEGGYKIIGTDHFKSMYDSDDDYILICAMPPMEGILSYEITGSFRYPVPKDKMDMIDFREQKLMDFEGILGPDKEKKLVFYCAQVIPGYMSHNAAAWAVDLGYKNVYRYIGGIKSWIENDYSRVKREVPPGVLDMLNEKAKEMGL